MRCRAAVLYEFNSPLVVEDVSVEGPRAREVLVKMAATGVCHSDLTSIKGVYGDPIPAILGHEGAGVVAEIGPDVTDLAIGDHVVLSWKPACRHCRPCLRGRPNLCEGSTWLDAGYLKDGTSRYSKDGKQILHFAGVSTFAEYSVVEDVCCVKIDKSLPLAPMSLIGCAVTTGAGAALNTAKIRDGDIVAVIGCGGVGLSAIQGARIRNAGTIIAIDRSNDSLALAQAMGATHAVNSANEDPVEAVRKIAGAGVDFAFEAVGRKETMELAAGILGRGGEAILIGIARQETRVETTPFVFVRREHALRGSFYGSAAPEENFTRLAQLYKEGKLDLDSMVRFRKLEEINEILAEMERGAVGRNVITF